MSLVPARLSIIDSIMDTAMTPISTLVVTVTEEYRVSTVTTPFSVNLSDILTSSDSLPSNVRPLVLFSPETLSDITFSEESFTVTVTVLSIPDSDSVVTESVWMIPPSAVVSSLSEVVMVLPSKVCSIFGSTFTDTTYCLPSIVMVIWEVFSLRPVMFSAFPSLTTDMIESSDTSYVEVTSSGRFSVTVSSLLTCFTGSMSAESSEGLESR